MRCVIIAGSPDIDTEYIRRVVRDGDLIVCADRGYEYALSAGLRPDLVIGDFDSAEKLPPDDLPQKRLNVRKDDTDTAACADYALSRGADEIILLGATGGRLDHSYANFCLLQYLSERGADARLCAPDVQVRLLTAGEYRFDGLSGVTFSLFPFGCARATADVTGASYPVSGFTFESGLTRGLSNVFEEHCQITVSDGQLLLFIMYRV